MARHLASDGNLNPFTQSIFNLNRCPLGTKGLIRTENLVERDPARLQGGPEEALVVGSRDSGDSQAGDELETHLLPLVLDGHAMASETLRYKYGRNESEQAKDDRKTHMEGSHQSQREMDELEDEADMLS